MSKQDEGRLVVTEGKHITRVQLQVGSKEFEETFPIVDIENVSLEDGFMQYELKTGTGNRVKQSLIKAKKIGMKNFRKAVMDPSFADDGESIIYSAGEEPAVGKSANWWDENARKFMPEKNSRLINDLQKDVFLGVLIKELVDNGYDVEKAWKSVCGDLLAIGQYYYKESNIFHQKEKIYALARTGNRPIGKWFDLGNTRKIVKKYEGSGFVRFSGFHNDSGCEYPFPFVDVSTFYIDCYGFSDSVGELVLDV